MLQEGVTIDPAAFAPRPAIETTRAQFDRAKLEAAIEVMIDLLDMAEPDIDMEDSEAGNARIDSRGRYPTGYVPDPQDEDREPDDDAQGDIAYTEWHTRGRHKLDLFGSEPAAIICMATRCTRTPRMRTRARMTATGRLPTSHR